MKGLILCGGKGTRLRPHTYSRPKPLLPVGNQSVIQHAISKLVKVGILDIGIVVSPHYQSQFQEAIGLQCQGAEVHYITQGEPKGLANALQCAESFIQDDVFCVVLGDNYYSGDLASMVKCFDSEVYNTVVLVNEVRDPTHFGVAELDGTRVVRLIEKPQTYVSPYALVGIYLLTPAIFEAISRLKPSKRGEYELTDAIQLLIGDGYNVTAMISDDWWRDTGSPNDFLLCNRYVVSRMRSRHEDDGAVISNSLVDDSVVLGKDTEIIDSTVRGPAVIGSGCRIVRSYIGPFTSIGDGTEISDSEIENSVVLEHTSILQVPRRIDASIIGGDTILQGTRKRPRTLQLYLGDHSQVLIPFDHND